MIALIQRVSNASVDIEGETMSSIGRGLLILLGVVKGDTEADVDWLVNKCAQMRIFTDSNGIMNLSLEDVGGDALVVSQFTLAGSIKKGNRPSYIHAAGHEIAIPLYESFCHSLSVRISKPVGRGQFGADMQVHLTNDGPVTIIADSKNPS